jgi:Uma2 family endonuclease
MTTATTVQRMTAEEFFDWVHRPENDDRWFELDRGKVIELSPPNRVHGRVCACVGFVLADFTFRRKKGYVTTNNAGVILARNPDTVRGPDVALYEDAVRFADLPSRYDELPPRIAVEVLSPDDRADLVVRKLVDYLAGGVQLVWLIDPITCTATVWRGDRMPYRVDRDGELSGEEVLPGLTCKLADLFWLPEEGA